MSKSDRDQRARPHSAKRCPEPAAGGCSWCGTGRTKQAHRRLVRRAGRRAAQRDADD